MNVFLYAVDTAVPKKHKQASAWREWLWRTPQGRVSYHVLQEFYANVCKKWPNEMAAARQEIRDLLAWGPLAIDGELLQFG